VAKPKPHFVREEEWQTVLRRALDLVGRDQLKLFRALSDSLGGDLWEEDDRARQARLRDEALAAMQAAATHLGLPEGQAPTIPEFKRAAKQTSLPMTFSAVYSAFDERWDVASRHYRGERIPETAAQRAMRRKYLGRREDVREAPLTGVRLFVTQDPPPAANRREDYETWAREFNENPRDGYKRISESASHICGQLGLGWDLVLAVAAGRTDPEQARKESLSAALSEAGPLVGHLLVSQMLGLSLHARHAKQATFPKPVFRFVKGNRMWLRSDIEGYAAGRRDFTHVEGVLQDQYLDGNQLGEEVLGVASLQAIRARVSKDAWEIVPRPAGKAGSRYYWSRADVERWLREKPRVLGPRRGRPKRAAP